MDISNLFGKINKSSLTNDISNSEHIKKPVEQDYVNRLFSGGKPVEVKGEVVDVSNKFIKIRVGNQIIQGNVNLVGKLNISDNRNFLLEMDKGRLKLTLIAESMDSLKNQHIESVLKDLGENSKENLEFAKILLESNLPVNKNTLNTLKRAIAIFGKNDNEALKKALLLLNNDIDINIDNANKTNNILNRQENVTENIKIIESLLSQLENKELSEEIEKILTALPNDGGTEDNLLKQPIQHINNSYELIDAFSKASDMPIENKFNEVNIDILKTIGSSIAKEAGMSKEEVDNLIAKYIPNETQNDSDNVLEKQIFSKEVLENETFLKKKILDMLSEVNNKNKENTIIKNFSVDDNIKNPKALENHINETIEKLEKALDILKHSDVDSEIAKSLEKEVSKLKDKMIFGNELKNSILIQIPFTLNNKTTNGELIVFKDKRRKGENSKKSSALISLDTINLGVFEAYLIKDKNKVDIQFRFVNDFVVGLVKNNLSQLNNMLGSKGIHINSITYKKIDEAFSPINEEPTINENEVDTENSAFKFDVRA